MVRTVPYGLQVGQVIEPLVSSEMTNGKIAIANVPYEIRVVYPGGVIILPAGDAPGGLLKAGTPVHVIGESEPTDEELARFVNAGVLHTSILTKDVSDAADFSVPAKTGEWDYTVNGARRVSNPRQASVICDILIESGRADLLESGVFALMREHGARFNSRQDPVGIFRYYKKTLVAAGFLITRRS